MGYTQLNNEGDKYVFSFGGCNAKLKKCYNDYYIVNLTAKEPIFTKGKHENMSISFSINSFRNSTKAGRSYNSQYR
jgi:hypothetical protein